MKQNKKIINFKCVLLFFSAIIPLLINNNDKITIFASNKNLNENNTKIYYDATIDDSFDDCTIMVTLNPNVSQYRGVLHSINSAILANNEVDIVEDISKLPEEWLNNDGTLISTISNDIKDHYSKIDFKQVLKITLSSHNKQQVLDTIKKIEDIEGVLCAEPNYYQEASSITINDSMFDEQWALIGENGINIQEAWEITTGISDIRVGVIDSGIANHEDLNANVVTGYDYVNDNNITTDDIGGHGTSVAGIIGAVGNNTLGISGINQNISLVPMQTAFDTNNNGKHYYSDIVKAVNDAQNKWGTDDEIPILNCSIGGFGTNGVISYSLLSAIENYQGLFVWSAGNNGINVDNYENINSFNLPNLISVGAHDKYNRRSIWTATGSSNYGTAVNIYAPGGKGVAENDENCITTHSVSTSSYRYFNGTSAAAPHVTGVAALLKSVDPNLTAQQIKTAIENSADSITITLPDNTTQNVKKLNAFSALKYVFNHYSANPITITDSSVSFSNSINENNDYFIQKNNLFRLNSRYNSPISFSISSNNVIDVTLYDSNLNEINLNINPSNNIEFEYTINPLSTYYLRVNYVNGTITGTINYSIEHLHDYDFRATYNNNINHKSLCACGEYILKPHVFNESDLTKCIICNGIIMGGGIIIRPQNIDKVSINGSYELTNGIIVLVDEDMEAFFDGALIFYNKNEIPEIM